jgi:hypothetical protein
VLFPLFGCFLQLLVKLSLQHYVYEVCVSVGFYGHGALRRFLKLKGNATLRIFSGYSRVTDPDLLSACVLSLNFSGRYFITQV